VSDEQNSGTGVPPSAPTGGGAFDWLIESHRQSTPMAPLTDDIPSPVAAPRHFDLPDPAMEPVALPSVPAQPVMQAPVFEVPLLVPPPVIAPAPALVPPPAYAASQPVLSAPTVEQFASAPLPPVYEVPAAVPPVAQPQPPLPFADESEDAPVPQARAFSFAAEPLAPSTFGGGVGASALALERHGDRARSGNGPLDWAAFILAFLAPPVGLILGVAAVISGPRTKGYATGIAKAAIGIGAALSVVLGVGLVVVTKISTDNAAHAAIVASSSAWCTKLRADPATLTSDTFGWPAPGDTIPASIAAIKGYEAKWDALVKVAPRGIRSDTQKVLSTARSIGSSVQSTQTLNDANNVAQLQNVVAVSGIKGWVSAYCG
jgi:hypothetical protein